MAWWRRCASRPKSPRSRDLVGCLRRRDLVGFGMISDEVGSPDYIAHYLWKLFIDERHQRRGYGTATLDLVVAYFRERPGGRGGLDERRAGPGQPDRVLRARRLRTDR
jgi:GNAT superfamily N-acetyltransferase